jgi:glycine/D-amino acid oxidase-like deaminating enzyme
MTSYLPCRVVICGGGIIGAATAYYLAQQGVGATVIEREAVAAAASGKAGGFLALDWNDSSPVGPLARWVAMSMAWKPQCSWHAHW